MKIRREHREILALKLIPGIGNLRLIRLLEAFGSAAPVFAATNLQLREVDGIGPETAALITDFDDWKRVDALLERTQKMGAQLVSIHDSEYPTLLKQICDAPPILWVFGSLQSLSMPAVAVVGTRRPDRYGMDQAEEWSEMLARSGFAVVSGLA
ncbi:MAG: DNA-processing protein DprA, partial [Balneolaceae bacterium]